MLRLRTTSGTLTRGLQTAAVTGSTDEVSRAALVRSLTKPRSKKEARESPQPRLTKTQLRSLTWKVNERKRRLRKTYGKEEGPVFVRRRANISTDNPKAWNRPLGVGVVPAYDEALRLIREDSRTVMKEADELRKKAQTEKELEKLEVLEVQSEVNLPDVRWSVFNGMADMTKPSHRHLVEQRWRKDGRLDMLMERIHQMNVVPDVLPTLQPSADLHPTFRLPHRLLRKSTQPNSAYDPGVFLSSDQTLVAPILYPTVFHTDTRLYTLLLVDPDVPYRQSFTAFLHWLVPNIPLSAAMKDRIPSEILKSHTAYIPPHPQKGSPYHRYSLFLLEQAPITDYARTTIKAATAPTSVRISVPIVEDRLHFDTRAFIRKYGLNPAKGGAAFMWRQKWDEGVSTVYRDVLRKPEPVYGLPPKFNPYDELKSRQKYT